MTTDQPMNDSELAACRAREQAATAEEWEVYEIAGYMVVMGMDGTRICEIPKSACRPGNMPFIAAAREDVPRLLATIDHLKAELVEVQELSPTERGEAGLGSTGRE